MGAKTKAASCYLMFAALSEIILEMYENTHLLKHYDPAIETKLKNLKVNFERTTKTAYGMFTPEEQKSFFNMINIFEQLIKAAEDTKDFSELMGIIAEWLKGEITIINTREELIKASLKPNRE